MRQAPKWLPYRVRKAVDQWRIDRAVAGLDRTAAMAVPGADQAAAQVHMLLCRRDLRIGVVALKSLLRFADGRLAVALSDDGTLTAADRAWVSGHVPGAPWLAWPVAEAAQRERVEAGLTNRPRLKALYHSSYAPVCKLLHATLLADCPRVIVLDPDTAFFEPPQRLLAWAGGEDAQPCYLHDHQDESVAVPAEAREGFADLEATLASSQRPWRLDRRLFNSGLLLFRPDQLDLDVAEAYLAWLAQAPERFKAGKAAIWFGDWTPEQTCYHVMYALSHTQPQPLGDDYHLGGAEGHVFNHFLRHYLVQDRTLVRLRALVASLPR